MRILSLGAGVQSTTLLLLAIHRELPAFDAAIFADTGWETTATYQHLDWLQGRAEAAGIPIYRVSAGDLRADAIAGKSEAWMPLHARGNRGQPVLLVRQCTRNYKLRPIRRQIRVLGGGPRRQVDLSIGISLDEIERMRMSDVLYISHSYPLIDLHLTRADCLAWMAKHAYARAPRSSCLGCPFRSNAEWRRLRDIDASAWQATLEADDLLRTSRAPRFPEAFIHSSLLPLRAVDLSVEQDHGQLELWPNECWGLCGV